MTEVEYRLKYPIGCKIRYTPNIEDVGSDAQKDIGKEGTVIEHSGNRVRVLLPTSSKWSKVWRTKWNHITLLSTGGQMLFNFTY